MRRLFHVLLLISGVYVASVGSVVAATHRLTTEEFRLFRMISRSPLQKRKEIELDPILCRVARARARDMGIRNYFSHVNPRGEGPNYLVRKAGYRLPGYYEFSKSANNIESIAAIFPGGSPRDGFVQWMSSFPHKSHLMGLTSFSRDQTHVGVGVVNIKKPPYGTYFVFISAPPNLSTKPPRVKLKTANGRFLAKSR